MTILSRMLKLRRITVDLTPGADPDAVIEIDDAREVYGEDFDVDDFGEIVIPCPKHPSGGQCLYSDADKYRYCIFCHQASGLDR